MNELTDINQLYDETKARNADIRRQQENLARQAENPEIERDIRQRTLQDIAERQRSIDLLESEWAAYVQSVKTLQNESGNLRVKLPTLELIRENARVQINLIQAVAMLQILKQNVGTIKATLTTLENIRLITLSPTRVRRLLGIA